MAPPRFALKHGPLVWTWLFGLVAFYLPIWASLFAGGLALLWFLSRRKWWFSLFTLAFTVWPWFSQVTIDDPPDLNQVIESINEAKERATFSPEQGVFSEQWHNDYVSTATYNLGWEPVTWQGNMPHQKKGSLQSGWFIEDRGVWLQFVDAIPNHSAPVSYQVTNLLLVDFSSQRMPSLLTEDTLFGRSYRFAEVNPKEGGVLAQISQALALPPPPIDVMAIPDPKHAPFPQWYGIFLLLLWIGVLWLWLKLASGRELFLTIFPLAIISFIPIPSNLALFDHSVFGTLWFGQLIRSPFHLASLTGVVLGLILRFRNLHFSFLPPVAAALTASVQWFPSWIQTNFNASLTHPLESLANPGSMAIFLTHFLVLATLVVMMDHWVRSFSQRSRWFTALLIILFSVLWAINQNVSALNLFISTSSILWIWFVGSLTVKKRYRLIIQVSAATAIFFPALHHREQSEELKTIRFKLIDEITLLQEKNHIRIARLIESLDRVHEERDLDHYRSMAWLAKKSGLLDEDVAFALELTTEEGRSISLFENYMTLNEVPFPLFPEDRIEHYFDEQKKSSWLVFRKSIELEEQTLFFTCVLSDDFRNLSIVRSYRNTKAITPFSHYITHELDVYDATGSPLFNSGAPNSLDQETLDQLEAQSSFWRFQGRNASFYFKFQYFTYRITHKKTPERMVLSRFITFVFFQWLIAGMVTWYVGHARKNWWRRSFAFQLATLIFLAGAIPAAVTSVYYSRSLQKNLSREIEEQLKATIFAAAQGYMDYQTLPLIGENERNSRLVQELSELCGEPITLYKSGKLAKTSQPELVRQGFLPVQLPWDLYQKLTKGSQPFHVQRDKSKVLQIGYFNVPNQEEPVILTLPIIRNQQRQNLRWQERMEVGLGMLLILLFGFGQLTLILAQRFLKPVRAITLGASRLGRGSNKVIELDRSDELSQMVKAFNTMQDRVSQSQNALTHQLGLFDVTLQAMNSGLFGCNRDGLILIQNPQSREILNWDSPSSLKDLAQNYPNFAPVIEEVSRSGEGEWNITIDKDGQTRQILVKLRSRIVKDPNAIRAILVFHDITHILEVNRFQAWSEMARRVAHDIKNPLTPIQLEMDHLLRIYSDRPEKFGEELKASADEIKSQVEQLRQISYEFGDYARPMKLEPQNTEINRFISDFIRSYRHFEELTIHFKPSEPTDLNLDVRLFQRALQNLVENAIHAQNREGELQITAKKMDEWFVLRIQDQGPGIPEEDQHRIFEAYFSTKDRGSGLGLPIAKKIIELHKGKLEIDPHQTIGTCFVILLPR